MATEPARIENCSKCGKLNTINALSMPKAFCTCGNQIYPPTISYAAACMAGLEDSDFDPLE